jgi:thioredoxin-dependent peroxiredoxin
MRNLTAIASLLALSLLTGDRFTVAEEKPQADTAHVDLQVGAAAPKFESIDERGRPWSSVEHVGKKYVVVYFYPADFTTGCIKQAETFRDSMNRLSDQGVEVIGVSGDAVRNHQLFKEAWQLNYTLLADETGAVATQFGVPITAGGAVSPFSPDRKPVVDENGQRIRLERKATFARWTFVIGKDGKVLYKNTKVNPVDDAKQISEFILKVEKEANATVE